MKQNIFRTFTKLTLVAALLGLSMVSAWAKPKRVLVVSTTTGFRHSSIETAQRILKQLGEKDGGFTIVDIVDGGPPPKDKSQADAWRDGIKRAMAEKMTAQALSQDRRRDLRQHDRRFAYAKSAGLDRLRQVRQGVCGNALGFGHVS